MGNAVKRCGLLMQPCRQEETDCFARTRRGNCSALEDTRYPCGACTFYKPAAQNTAECRGAYSRLVALGRTDLIARYGAWW